MRLMFRKILCKSFKVCILLMQRNNEESGMLKVCTKLFYGCKYEKCYMFCYLYFV